MTSCRVFPLSQYLRRTSSDIVGRAADFVKGRPHDFKVIVARQGLQRFLYQLTFPYQSIFIVGLGATSVELGVVNSVGIGIGAIAAPFTGWLIDRRGAKGVYLVWSHGRRARAQRAPGTLDGDAGPFQGANQCAGTHTRWMDSGFRRPTLSIRDRHRVRLADQDSSSAEHARNPWWPVQRASPRSSERMMTCGGASVFSVPVGASDSPLRDRVPSV